MHHEYTVCLAIIFGAESPHSWLIYRYLNVFLFERLLTVFQNNRVLYFVE